MIREHPVCCTECVSPSMVPYDQRAPRLLYRVRFALDGVRQASFSLCMAYKYASIVTAEPPSRLLRPRFASLTSELSQPEKQQQRGDVRHNIECACTMKASPAATYRYSLRQRLINGIIPPAPPLSRLPRFKKNL